MLELRVPSLSPYGWSRTRWQRNEDGERRAAATGHDVVMAAHAAPTHPFRWDVTRREQLGGLVTGPGEDLWFCDELEECAARVLARCANARQLYFVGRSPASIFDFLSGALADTSWSDRLALLPFSMRWPRYRLEVLDRPHLRRQLEANLAALGLHPHDLQRGSGAVAFVDLVAEGGTFENLVYLLRLWAEEVGAQWDVIRTKLRWVAITRRRKPSPNEWRWHQHVEWGAALPRSAVVNVSLDWAVWKHLAEYQAKATPSFPYWRWHEVNGPRYSDEALVALSTAVQLFEHGKTVEARHRLVRRLAGEPSFSQRWLRTLALELRRSRPAS